ncbi:MAG: outer membrane protein transport protein [Nitrospirota bacterium]
MFFVSLLFVLFLAFGGDAQATNGDNLMGIGPISRTMGGVGIAAPQDPIGAVFANPAAMCFGPYCPRSEANVTTTLFAPRTRAKVKSPGAGINTSAKSKADLFLIPAIGVSTPLVDKWRFGFAAYGTSGLGVDYRERLDLEPATPGHQGDLFTEYRVLKLAPNIAYLVNEHLSLGASFHVDYASLDMGLGTSSGEGFGFQVGAIYKKCPFAVGISYVSPQSITHRDVAHFDTDGIKDNLTLEQPQSAGAGIAYAPSPRLLIEANVKWINWGDAKGYRDFDWRDQWVYAFGIQYNPASSLALRAGINYGRNPVRTHQGFNADTASFTPVQGKNVSTFNYELLRIIGFPAIAETHVTFGAGYRFTQRFEMNIGYTHAFRKTASETGKDFGGPGGPDVSLTSKLAENSFEFGISWRF